MRFMVDAWGYCCSLRAPRLSERLPWGFPSWPSSCSWRCLQGVHAFPQRPFAREPSHTRCDATPVSNCHSLVAAELVSDGASLWLTLPGDSARFLRVIRVSARGCLIGCSFMTFLSFMVGAVGSFAFFATWRGTAAVLSGTAAREAPNRNLKGPHREGHGGHEEIQDSGWKVLILLCCPWSLVSWISRRRPIRPPRRRSGPRRSRPGSPPSGGRESEGCAGWRGDRRRAPPPGRDDGGRPASGGGR